MTPVERPFDAVIKLVRKEIDDPQPNQEVVDKLMEIGYAALVRAAESKETGNITLNQLEAFGCAVYFRDRKLATKFLDKSQYRGTHRGRKGFDVDSAEPDPKRHRMGRSMALHELRDHTSDARSGYELYLTNAMWYSAIHEQGWTMRNGTNHRPLRIITQEILDTVAQIETTFGVDVLVNVWYNSEKK